MGRHKGRPSKKLNFCIDLELAERFKDLAEYHKIGKSQFLEMLIHQWDQSLNPESKLSSLLNERKEMVATLGILEGEINKTSNHITITNKLKQQKIRRKPEALKRIEQLLLEEDFERAEVLSRSLQKETGISAIELIIEATNNINTKGI